MGDIESKKDEMKGRMKEAAGDMMDDDELKREGKADRIGGAVKEKANEAWEHAKEHPISSTAITVAGLIGAGAAIWAVGHFGLVAEAKQAIGL